MGLLVIAALVLVAGGVCGIVAVIHLAGLKHRIAFLEREVERLSHALEALQVWQQEASRPPAQKATRRRATTAAPADEAPVPNPLSPVSPLPPPAFEPVAGPRKEWTSLEVVIGAKWFNLVGVILLIVGVMFFLKYAYDNNWIGPTGRIAIAAVAGAAALTVGELFRRASYPVLFHSLTGGGLAIFYGSIYFSFQVYGLTGQAVSFLLSVLVTALAVAISVVHNAPLICLLGQLGGFLSPVLISSGENRPIALFSFVTILNIATLGCAYLKNWRYVNAAGFIGTWALYVGWVNAYYDESQLGIAFFFSALFYLTFLIAPMLRAFSRRQRLLAEDLWLVALVILVEFINNYALLYEGYRPWVGLAVVLQALTLSALYAQWTRRLAEDSTTRTTLLLFALALVTAAIPIQLRFYAIPIGWAIESLMLGYVGQRYRSWQFQVAALVAVVLAAVGLLYRLPLHTELFTPVFNRAFGSWITVTAMMWALYILWKRNPHRIEPTLRQAVPAIAGLGLVLACGLAHMEVATFWSVRADQLPRDVFLSRQFTSLSLLWSVIPLLFLRLGRGARFSAYAAFAAYVTGVLVFLIHALTGDWIVPAVPFFNPQWLSRFCIVLSLWIGVKWMQSFERVTEKPEDSTIFLHTLEGAGHVILAILLFVEVNSWISSSGVFSPFMRFGFVSAVWSLQALALIGFGLKTRSQFRRILGFVLFGATIMKLLLVDVSVLQPVYRILSFAATGALLIAAAYLYQRFAKGMLDSPSNDAQPVQKGAS